MRTMKDMAKEALMVQDACNLSGVIHSWSRIAPELREAVVSECAAKGIPFSTDVLNTHPVNVLFANKVGALTGSHDPDFSKAYQWALDITK